MALPLPSLLPRELHTTDRPSSTAQATAIGRAVELARREPDRIVTDVYAPAFLTTPARALAGSLRRSGGLFRVGERSALGAISVSALCRHRFIDDHLLAALPGVSQVVVLGAGYDARAYRFADEIADRPVYEVDLAPLSRRKARIVSRNAALFGHVFVRRVEIDFRTESLADRLTSTGFVTGEPTFVVWEGVSMYLDRAAVHGTLSALSSLCGSGSVLAMDCWQQVGGSRPYALARAAGERSFRFIGEPLTFHVAAPDAGDLLGQHDFDVVDLVEADEATARYATARRHCDPGMYTLAARRR